MYTEPVPQIQPTELFSFPPPPDPVLLPTDSDTHSVCGTWHCSGSLKDGNPVHYQQFCEKWRDRECLSCFKRRVRKFKFELGQAYLDYGEEEFYVVTLSEFAASELARRCVISGSLYKRYPTADGVDYVVFQPFLDCPDSEMSWKDLDWELLANTPKHRRPSGKLVPVKAAVDEGPVYQAEVMTIEYSAPAAIVQASWRAAIELTADFDPKTPEEAERAINERLNYVAFYLADFGGKIIKTYYRKVSIPENSVLSWNKKETLDAVSELAYLDLPRIDANGDPAAPF